MFVFLCVFVMFDRFVRLMFAFCSIAKIVSLYNRYLPVYHTCMIVRVVTSIGQHENPTGDDDDGPTCHVRGKRTDGNAGSITNTAILLCNRAGTI